ncbi:NAD(P)H-dependent oxidoreductase [Candidatus Woesearchaeota archaeon]|nr:NAD(P)H-dependent oxidoreductase [Candidatus Woesearchaeota archaeon]HIJ02108.1 NAD(P)H-dependent oxidoreductase [Candidatus Woesearchaeota archaeon]
MEFREIVMKRYATKSFDGRAIPEIKISELMELIRYSTSSFGLQPYKIKVISDKETKEKLMPASRNQPQISSCSHLFVFCADTGIIPRIERLQEMMIANGAKPESLKGYVDMMRGFEQQMPEDKKLIWAQKQAYIALGNAINGAKSLGFDSCPMEGFDPVEYAKILDLPKNLVAAVLCPVGYANDNPKPKIRFSKEELFF